MIGNTTTPVNEAEVVSLQSLVRVQEKINAELVELAQGAEAAADAMVGGEPKPAEAEDEGYVGGYLYLLASRQQATFALLRELRHQIDRLNRAAG